MFSVLTCSFVGQSVPALKGSKNEKKKVTKKTAAFKLKTPGPTTTICIRMRRKGTQRKHSSLALKYLAKDEKLLDLENRLVVAKGEEEGVGWTGSLG